LPHAAPGADQPDLPPVYRGPTPANPFGGHGFDIFDVMERVEETAAAPTRPEPAPEQAAEPQAEARTALVEELSPSPIEAASSGAQPVSEPPSESAPEPIAAGDAEPEPAIKPIVIGSGEAPVAEKKRGWWRR
jgi:ribonuclease E